jgi:hypothetical protein
MCVRLLEGSLVFDEDDIQNRRNQAEEILEEHHSSRNGTRSTRHWDLVVVQRPSKLYAGIIAKAMMIAMHAGLIAQAKWEEIGGSGSVPVETNGAAGVHWDEACMGEEVMTGYSTYANRKILLSKVMIGSLEVMGYIE